MKTIWLVSIALIVGTFGCAGSEKLPQVAPPVELPGAYLNPVPDPGQLNQHLSDRLDWWKIFGSKELNQLVSAALDNNFDLRILQSRVDQAEASVRQIRAGFFPSLDASAGGDRSHTRTKDDTSTRTDSSHSWDASLVAIFVPDIWGKLSARQKTSIYELNAARMDLHQASYDLSQTIAETWIDMVTVREKQKILDRQVENNQILLKLLKLRFVNGRATALEVSQQQEALAQAKAQVPILKRDAALLFNTLAFLSGSPSPGQVEINTTALPMIKKMPAVGIPSDLLQNRPDIRAAQLRLFSSRWNVTAAQRDRFPDLKMTAQALFSSGKLDLLFQNWVASLAASFAGNIFDGGQKKSKIELNQEIVNERVVQYAKTVAQAVREVENSLVTIEQQDVYVVLLGKELAAARITLKDAQVQYRNGQSSYLNYLVTWNKIQGLERRLAGEKAIALKSRIALFGSLGWKIPSD